MRSVIPADSILAWATIYSGVDPSHHGVLASINYTKAVRSQFEESAVDFGGLQGRTFWDHLSRAGKKVCVLNPFLAYPAWPVNGLMISDPPLTRRQKTAFPADLVDKYDIPDLGGIADFPSKVNLDQILSHASELTTALLSLALHIMVDFEWDLFFVYFLALGRVEHFFWRFGDPEDPQYSEGNRFSRTIKDFYVLIDSAVGKLQNKLTTDYAIMVISDHGHRRRATRLLNVNELLRRESYLVPIGSTSSRLLEGTRSTVVKVAHRLHAEGQLFRFGRFVPKASEMRKSRLSIDYTRSKGILSDFGGSTSFGGILLNREAIMKAGLTYKDVQSKMLSLLASLRDPSRPDKIVRELYTREELYHGPHSDKFPNVVFVLDNDYGVHWSIYDSLVVPDYAHRLVSGGHDQAAVFILHGCDMKPTKSSGELVDIAPTVLHLLGVTTDTATQGQSLFA